MSEYYFELSILPQKYYEQFLELIESLVDDAFEENEGSIIIRSEEKLDDLKLGIEKFAKALDIKCEINYTKKENINWIKEYQKSVKSVEIGNFFIRPSWEDKKDNKIDIIIDPALSFGSGHHETTASCIEAIDEFLLAKQSVLDVGTGSGILAIASAKKGCIVDICDTDEVCINDTKLNFELNSTKFNEAWVGSVNKATKKYDVVIANIVADVLIILANDLKKVLNDNGLLIISGILDKHENKVLAKFKDLEVIRVIHKNEWITAIFKK